jgi:hypothetical protein
VPLFVWWILFGAPLAAVVGTWVGLCFHWRAEQHRVTKILANLLATAAPALACGALVYMQLGGRFASQDYSVDKWGLLLSFSGIVMGSIASRSPAWYSWLAIGVSAWMFVLFFLSALTA